MKRHLSKKSYALTLLCSLALLVTLVCSCQQSRLKAVVAVAGKQCPISMGDIGTITQIVYRADNVEYTFRVNEEYTDIAALRQHPEQLKASALAMYRHPTPEVKEMLQLVVRCRAGIRMTFVGAHSGDEVVCLLTSDELRVAIDDSSSPADGKLEKLNAQIRMANLQMPMQASDEVNIEKIVLEEKSVVYLCHVDEEQCSIELIESNAAEVKKEIMDALSSQTDQATRFYLQTCIDNARGITYRYIGASSGAQYEVCISVAELEKMIINKQ